MGCLRASVFLVSILFCQLRGENQHISPFRAKRKLVVQQSSSMGSKESSDFWR